MPKRTSERPRRIRPPCVSNSYFEKEFLKRRGAEERGGGKKSPIIAAVGAIE